MRRGTPGPRSGPGSTRARQRAARARRWLRSSGPTAIDRGADQGQPGTGRAAGADTRRTRSRQSEPACRAASDRAPCRSALRARPSEVPDTPRPRRDRARSTPRVGRRGRDRKGSGWGRPARSARAHRRRGLRATRGPSLCRAAPPRTGRDFPLTPREFVAGFARRARRRRPEGCRRARQAGPR